MGAVRQLKQVYFGTVTVVGYYRVGQKVDVAFRRKWVQLVLARAFIEVRGLDNDLVTFAHGYGANLRIEQSKVWLRILTELVDGCLDSLIQSGLLLDDLACCRVQHI